MTIAKSGFAATMLTTWQMLSTETMLKCDTTDPNRLGTTDYLGRLLGGWDASRYTESFDREPLTAHILL
jgi:hypothetical protein